MTEDREEFRHALNNTEVEVDTSTQVERITIFEIKKALKYSKNEKSAGPRNIRIELIKHGLDILIEILGDIFNKCLIEADDIPEEWNLAYVNSIHKRGDKKLCKNYRGISVVS